MTLDQINFRLEELKNQKTKVKGLETEIYARIVGYYRSVRNWNKGKKEEYAKRLNYAELITRERSTQSSLPQTLSVVEAPTAQKELRFTSKGTTSSYLYFFRQSCPNCPPVAKWLEESGLDGRRIDVDRESGMLEARRHDVIAAPTVILLDDGGQEISRASNVNALDAQIGVAEIAGA